MAICERPRPGKSAAPTGESLKRQIIAAHNAVAEAKKVAGGSPLHQEAMGELTGLIAGPGGLDALRALPKNG